MTTPSRRAFVSLAALTTLLLAGCAHAPSRPVTQAGAESLTIRFDNLSRESVHVYLIGLKREWLLGKVEPGAIRSLKIPEPALAEEASFVRLAVIAGERATLDAARHGGATVTLAHPVSALVSQQWRFTQGELTASSLPR